MNPVQAIKHLDTFAQQPKDGDLEAALEALKEVKGGVDRAETAIAVECGMEAPEINMEPLGIEAHDVVGKGRMTGFNFTLLHGNQRAHFRVFDFEPATSDELRRRLIDLSEILRQGAIKKKCVGLESLFG